MLDDVLALTGRQLRAARILAAYDIKDLAAESGLAAVTIQRLERDPNPFLSVRLDTLSAIVTALASRGVTFVPNGVQGSDTKQAATLPKLAEVVTA
jgi:hypothetical protein